MIAGASAGLSGGGRRISGEGLPGWQRRCNNSRCDGGDFYECAGTAPDGIGGGTNPAFLVAITKAGANVDSRAGSFADLGYNRIRKTYR